MWKQIVAGLKELYIKLSCYMCCRSKCALQIGRTDEPSTPSTVIRETEL